MPNTKPQSGSTPKGIDQVCRRFDTASALSRFIGDPLHNLQASRTAYTDTMGGTPEKPSEKPHPTERQA